MFGKRQGSNVIDALSIHMNPDGDSGSDGEHESNDTIGVIVHDVKTSTCSRHSHCNVNDKCFCTDNSC